MNETQLKKAAHVLEMSVTELKRTLFPDKNVAIGKWHAFSDYYKNPFEGKEVVISKLTDYDETKDFKYRSITTRYLHAVEIEPPVIKEKK